MSLPNIPNITPKISLERCDTINLLLSSIALEEIGLSHILNAEGEKLQYFLKTCPENYHDYLKINNSINNTLRTIIKSQLLLQLKLEDVVTLNLLSGCHNCSEHHDHPTKCSSCFGKLEKDKKHL
ncbi:hypothetical protein [Lysinibacillus telephonicus]|uniref:hypothetical protein n=1 Tax=Lysinibacillus telephonicus TaxID=1714840 RepID=UPI001FE46ED6|nr:hypothetical protein [Lysinibacillus telephonicus]